MSCVEVGVEEFMSSTAHLYVLLLSFLFLLLFWNGGVILEGGCCTLAAIEQGRI